VFGEEYQLDGDVSSLVIVLFSLFATMLTIRFSCRSKLIPTLLLQYDLELTEPEKEWKTSCYWFVMQQGLNVRLTQRSPANWNAKDAAADQH
jgi:hypothetical protein